MNMDHEKKLAFVHRMTKMALEHVPHLDGGGVISAGNSNPLSGIAGALTAQNSYTAQAPTSASTVGQQQAQLAGQLGTEAAGGGPSPAQIQYEQNANQIAQGAATNYAQNRSLNPGLAARMAGNTAAQTGQTAAGGAAAQQAQQQLAAQQEMGELTGQEQTGALQAAGINSQVSQNNANAVNNTQGGILSSLPIVGSLFADGGEVKKMAQGGSVNVYSLGIPTFSNVNDLPDMSGGSGFSNPFASKPTNPVVDPQQNPVNSAAGADVTSGAPAGSALSLAGIEGAAPDAAAAALAKGGKVHKPMPNMSAPPQYPSAAFASGGMTPGGAGQQSFAGKFLSGQKMAGGGLMQTAMQLAPLAMMAANKGGLMKSGGKVNAAKPSEKAVVKDDSLKNDKVPAMLSQGEIVIPRHITQHPNAPQKAAEFVQHVLSKKRMGKK